MIPMEELQKACETLAEACETLAEAWNKVLEPTEELTKALIDAFGRMYSSEEKKRKSVNRMRDFKRPTYTYKPVARRNLPYQRRNF